jgi:hypothetical protein
MFPELINLIHIYVFLSVEKPYAIIHTLNAWSRVSTSTPETELTLDITESSEGTYTCYLHLFVSKFICINSYR